MTNPKALPTPPTGGVAASWSATSPIWLRPTNAAAYLKAPGIVMPPVEELYFGGLIGSVLITDIVTAHSSPWFHGPAALVLADPRPEPFLRLRGQVGLFQVQSPWSASRSASRRWRRLPVRFRSAAWAEPNERGERLIWLEDAMADRLGAMRRPGESYSDVILRIAMTGGQNR
jgi:hypothetical protein